LSPSGTTEVFESEVLGRIFEPRREEDEANLITAFINVLLSKYCDLSGKKQALER
jgi:hypothetical protein